MSTSIVIVVSIVALIIISGLIGKLSKANQRNAKLKRELAKTKDDSASAKLEVPGCSAYRTLLDAIYSERGIETDVAGQKKCRQELRDASEKLWAEFKKSVISPDYSKLDYQEAYLLCYFLPYSQPIPSEVRNVGIIHPQFNLSISFAAISHDTVHRSFESMWCSRGKGL